MKANHAADATEVTDSQKRKAPADAAVDGGPPRRTKKGKKGRRGGNSSASGSVAAEPAPQDLVAVSPLAPNSEILQEGWRPVMLSKVDKAPQMTLGEDRLSVTSSKGYRMVRATHGAHQGTWYYEVRVTHLGATGHARIGWATRKAELQAPVGYDQHGYGYRDLQGSKVHKGLREEFGEPYREGDVIGCLLHLPLGGRPLQSTRADVRTYKGGLYVVDELAEAPPQPLPGALVAFARNGASQHVAYRELLEGTHYPAVSLYTLPEQAAGASLSVNFGPHFKHAPPDVEGVPQPRPVSDLANVGEDIHGAAPGGESATRQQQHQQQQPGGGAAAPAGGDAGAQQAGQVPQTGKRADAMDTGTV